MNHLRAACGVMRLDGMRNEKIYDRVGMRDRAGDVNSGVPEWVVD